MAYMKGLLAGAAVVALSSTAFAQTSDTVAPAPAGTAAGSDVRHAAAVPDSGLGDIVVTARRRAESLQSVPVAVTAITSETLRQKTVTSPYDLLAVSPGLQVQTGSASRNDPIYFIRGQGQTSQGETSVVQYFAEVPQPNFGESIGSNIQFFDLDSIQVLKGPQGTLFGRSSTGGAVLFTPKRPSYNFDGFVELTFGNYAHKELTAAVNIPLIDNVLAVRAAANLVDRRGFARSLTTGQDLDDRRRQSYRLGVLFTPTSWLSNYLVYQDNSANENGSATVPFRSNPNLPLLDTSATGAGRGTVTFICGLIGGGQPCIDSRIATLDSVRNDIISEQARIDAGGDPRRYLNSGRNFNRFRIQQIINNTEINIPIDGFLTALKFKNIFSTYRIKRTEEYKDITYTSLPHAAVSPFADLINGQRVAGAFGSTKWFDAYSEEAQFQGTVAGKHDFILGYFYERNNRNQFNNGPVLFGAFGGAFSVPEGAFGVSSGFTRGFLKAQRGLFGSATVDLSDVGLDGVKFTAGYRRSQVKNKITVLDAATTPNGLVPVEASAKSARDNENANSYTFSLDWKATRNILLYATTRRGFKQGGINLQALQFPNSVAAVIFFRPEIVTDVELGAKTDWRIGEIRGRTNIAIFNSNFSNVQRGSNFINTSGGVSSQILNIAKSRVRGIELENTFRLSDALTVGLNYGYLDAKYLRYPGTVVNGAGQVVPLINSPYTGAPKHKVDLDVRYKLPMDENIGQVTAGANFSYQSKVYTNDTAIEDPLDESIRVGGILNLRLDWENVKGNPIDLSVFVRNVTNNTYIIGTAGLYNALGTVGAIYGDPRTFGVQARVRFGASANH